LDRLHFLVQVRNAAFHLAQHLIDLLRIRFQLVAGLAGSGKDRYSFFPQALNRLAWNCKARVWLSPDFVPNSWYFQIYPKELNEIPDDWRKHRIMNGGVIYHGPLENGTRPETFAITLTQENSWSIHTY
jgi:hypothetical protein